MNAPQPLNFLFLFPDQWRWDWLGCERYGIAVRTPNLDALAARGVRFTQCRTPSPVCSPARACLATGRRYHRCGVPSNAHDLDTTLPNHYQRLRDGGYRVAGSGKFDLFKATPFKGLDGWTDDLGRAGFTEAFNQSGKFDCTKQGWPEPQDLYAHHLNGLGLMATHHEDYTARKQATDHMATMVRPTPLPREHYTDDFTSQRAMDLLDGFGRDEPWYLWVNFPGPHDPFDPPRELLDRYRDVAFPPPVLGEPRIDHQRVRRSYAACCEGIDEWVGRLIDAVESRGELDRTVIVFSSDHGEQLGDHGRFGKTLPLEPSVHVPLIVAGPGVRQAAVSDALVEMQDIAATVLDLAGVEPLPDADTRSLRPVLRGDQPHAAHRPVQVSALKDWRMVTDGRWKLAIYDDGRRLLFDLQADPGESTNLADRHGDQVRRLEEALDRELR